MSARRSKNDTEFGAVVSQSLTAADMTQPELAKKLGVSTGYVNQVITGRKKASAAWADCVAEALKLSAKDRSRLHVAAARQHGFRIPLYLDLTKKTI